MFQAFHIILYDPQNSPILQLRKQKIPERKPFSHSHTADKPQSRDASASGGFQMLPLPAAQTRQDGIFRGVDEAFQEGDTAQAKAWELERGEARTKRP